MSFSGILLCDGRAEVGGRLTQLIEVDGVYPVLVHCEGTLDRFHRVHRFRRVHSFHRVHHFHRVHRFLKV